MQIRGLLSTIMYGDAVGTKVIMSGRSRQGGRSSGVAVKRGSTVVREDAQGLLTRALSWHCLGKRDSSTSLTGNNNK